MLRSAAPHAIEVMAQRARRLRIDPVPVVSLKIPQNSAYDRSIQTVLASLLVASWTFSQIIAYFVFVTVLFVGLTVAGLFRVRRRSPDASYRAWGYPATPVVFLILVLFLLVLLGGHNPLQAAAGVAIVAERSR